MEGTVVESRFIDVDRVLPVEPKMKIGGGLLQILPFNLGQ